MAVGNKELERLINERTKHKGEWLTEEAITHYRNKAKMILDNSGQDAFERRKLRKEFQERYGLLDIEAINILNGYHASFYFDKYQRIKNLIPVQSKSQKDALEKED